MAEKEAPKRGWLFRRLHPLLSYVITNFSVAVLWVLFRVCNRTTVIGRENVGYGRNTLLLCNHQSMIDSFLIGGMVYFPRSLIRPYLMPWNPAAVENFWKNPVLGWFSDVWRCIPIREGRRDLQALKRMIQVFPRGVMTLFPEGTRMRTDVVGEGQPGAGAIIFSARPKVVPVAIHGMQDVLPIGAYLPRFFKKVYVHYGEPFDYSSYLENPRTKETYQELVDEVMGVIRGMHDELKRRH